MSPHWLLTTALCSDVPRDCHCFSQLLPYLHGANFAFHCMKPIRISLEGRSGDHSCHFCCSPSSPFTHLPELCPATPSASPLVHAASSCQGAAAASQHPRRKMPAMTFCEGNRQNRSAPCQIAFDPVPSPTAVLKCQQFLLVHFWLQSEDFSRSILCLFIYLTRQLLLIFWRQHPIATPACTQ